MTTQQVSDTTFRGFSNDTVNLNAPTPITVGQQVSDVIGADGNVPAGSDDVDLFTLVPSTSGAFIVRTTTSTEGSADTFLRVFDQSGKELAFNDNASSLTTASSVQVALTAGQTYYIGVRGALASGARPAYDPLTGAGAAAGSTGTYLLDVTAQSSVITPPINVHGTTSAPDARDGNLLFLFLHGFPSAVLDGFKQDSTLSGTDIAAQEAQLKTSGILDVNKDGVTDATDGNLLFLELHGFNADVLDGFKGSSTLAGAQIFANIEALKQGGAQPAVAHVTPSILPASMSDPQPIAPDVVLALDPSILDEVFITYKKAKP